MTVDIARCHDCEDAAGKECDYHAVRRLNEQNRSLLDQLERLRADFGDRNNQWARARHELDRELERLRRLEERVVTTVNEAVGIQPVTPAEDLLTLLDKYLFEQSQKIERLRRPSVPLATLTWGAELERLRRLEAAVLGHADWWAAPGGEEAATLPEVNAAVADAIAESRAARAKSAPAPCPKCDGCGQVADSDDREPWSFWANLPPGSDLAVRVGLVKPIPCPKCGGKAVDRG